MALKCKGLESIPSAPSPWGLGFQQGSSYTPVAAQFGAQISSIEIASGFEDHREAFFPSKTPCTSIRKYVQHLSHHLSLSKVGCSKSNRVMK